MSDLIHKLSASDENCWGHTDGILEGHRFDEIYTCLDCVENGVRKAERERIIKLISGNETIWRSAIIADLIALIKGKNK